MSQSGERLLSSRIHLVPVPTVRLFPISKAAKYVGLSHGTLIKYTDLGHVKAFNFHGRRTYKLEDLDALIDSLPEWENGHASNPRRSED